MPMKVIQTIQLETSCYTSCNGTNCTLKTYQHGFKVASMKEENSPVFEVILFWLE